MPPALTDIAAVGPDQVRINGQTSGRCSGDVLVSDSDNKVVPHCDQTNHKRAVESHRNNLTSRLTDSTWRVPRCSCCCAPRVPTSIILRPPFLTHPCSQIAVQAGDVRLYVERRWGAHSAVGYLQNVRIEVGRDLTSDGSPSICAVRADGDKSIPRLVQNRSLFDEVEYSVCDSTDSYHATTKAHNPLTYPPTAASQRHCVVVD